MLGKLETDARDFLNKVNKVRYIYTRTTGKTKTYLTPRMLFSSPLRIRTAKEALQMLRGVFVDLM